LLLLRRLLWLLHLLRLLHLRKLLHLLLRWDLHLLRITCLLLGIVHCVGVGCVWVLLLRLLLRRLRQLPTNEPRSPSSLRLLLLLLLLWWRRHVALGHGKLLRLLLVGRGLLLGHARVVGGGWGHRGSPVGGGR